MNTTQNILHSVFKLHNSVSFLKDANVQCHYSVLQLKHFVPCLPLTNQTLEPCQQIGNLKTQILNTKCVSVLLCASVCEN